MFISFHLRIQPSLQACLLIGLVLFVGSASAASQFRFSLFRPITEGSPPLITGDLNRDGKLDVVFTRGRRVLLLLGKGDGRFANPKAIFKASPKSLPQSQLADFNGDGAIDLAVLSQRKSGDKAALAVMLGKGDGKFDPPSTVSVPQYANTILPAEDYTGDGKVDLVIRSTNPGCNKDGSVCIPTDDTVLIVQGQGDGSFQPLSNDPLVSNLGGFSGGLHVADINKDGLSDVVVLARSAGRLRVGVMKGNADGLLKMDQETTIEQQGLGPAALASGDFNGDGLIDLAIRTADLSCKLPFCVRNNGLVLILLGQGDGTFVSQGSVSTGTRPVSLTASDFDGDGLVDLMTNSAPDERNRGSILLLQGQGDGGFSPKWNFVSTKVRFGELLTADADSDGRPDIFVVSGGKVRLMQNQTR